MKTPKEILDKMSALAYELWAYAYEKQRKEPDKDIEPDEYTVIKDLESVIERAKRTFKET